MEELTSRRPAIYAEASRRHGEVQVDQGAAGVSKAPDNSLGRNGYDDIQAHQDGRSYGHSVLVRISIDR